MLIAEEEYLMHYGILRRSGRYPWGSHGPEILPPSPNKRNQIFIDHVANLRKQGLSDLEIARGMGISTTELRAANSHAKNQQRQADIVMAQRLHDKGYSNVAIGKRMNKPESTVRALLAPGAKDKSNKIETTANMLKKRVDEVGFLDVGKGVENNVGVSSTMLDTALSSLKQQGYEVHTFREPSAATKNKINRKVLCLPGTTQKEAFVNRDKIQLINKFSDDNGKTFYGIHPPIKFDIKRLDIRYAEDGGSAEDGVIYVRPGVRDVELGGAKYAQVRIAVGDNHYIKGMAMYKDDLPEGIDLQFNTSKKNTGNKVDALKTNTGDETNPFGTVINRQLVDDPDTPNERPYSVMNIVREEGQWETWSKSLSSQMLSKQSRELAKSQLDMTYEGHVNDYKNIKKLTNNTVRKKLLLNFADNTDSSASHLKAAYLPRTGNHVILPLSKIKPTEVYAPNYVTGDRVALIRHPHGGTFEIPDLIVNNNNREGKKLLKDSRDAIGIHHEVAQRLSGADFDGDTVLVIPNNQGRIKITSALKELENFDPRAAYPKYEGMKVLRNTQTEMGIISNLITDMSIKLAPPEHIARAIKHSMVVIDAEKHELDHKLSYNDNGIKELQQKYQTGGASTLLSRAGAKVRVPKRMPRPMREGGPIDPETGRRVFVRSGEPGTEKIRRLSLEEDAFVLSTGTPMETLYATHSNKLKALANQARLDALKIPPSKTSPLAKRTYKKEVDSLDAKLTLVNKNKPLERQAHTIANERIRAILNHNPDMEEDTKKKVRFQSLEIARKRTGASKTDIVITQKEWDAIQAGAISDSKLNDILNNADMKRVRELATPKDQPLMTATMTSRAKQMLESGYTRGYVAQHLGVSLSTLDNATGG